MDPSLRRRAIDARAPLAAGALRGPVLLEMLRSVPWCDRDMFLDELLTIDPPPPDMPDLPRGAVPYLACGVDEILAMVQELPLRSDDELVDLGSGLGRVVILGHLLTGARARGVEIQPHLVHVARATCAAFSIPQVTFTHANAADVVLDGSVFFLYAPCNGAMLAGVVERIAEVARRRTIKVCTVGLELDVPWLVSRGSPTHALSIYASR